MSTAEDWGALARRAERGELKPVKDTAITGDRAAARGQAALLAATGTENIGDAARVALGRPKLGETRDTHMWRVRATPQLDAAVTDLARREGRTRSEVIRSAVAEYTAAHA